MSTTTIQPATVKRISVWHNGERLARFHTIRQGVEYIATLPGNPEDYELTSSEYKFPTA